MDESVLCDEGMPSDVQGAMRRCRRSRPLLSESPQRCCSSSCPREEGVYTVRFPTRESDGCSP